MRRFYQVQPITLEDVIAKYTPRIQGREPTFSHIVLLSDVPIGKMQCYRNIDWPYYAADINLHDGVSIDYFIGEPSALGKGYGSLMVSTYLQEYVFRLFLDEGQCYVCHNASNTQAIHCSEAAGFHFVRDVIENGIPSKLYLSPKP